MVINQLFKCPAKQSNQNAKLRFISNFSPSRVAGHRKEPGKSANLTDDLIRGKITPKRSRDEENKLTKYSGPSRFSQSDGPRPN